MVRNTLIREHEKRTFCEAYLEQRNGFNGSGILAVVGTGGRGEIPAIFIKNCLPVSIFIFSSAEFLNEILVLIETLMNEPIIYNEDCSFTSLFI